MDKVFDCLWCKVYDFFEKDNLEIKWSNLGFKVTEVEMEIDNLCAFDIAIMRDLYIRATK